MRRAALEERVTILEERIKAFEAPPEHRLALADAKAGARSAEQRLQRTFTALRRAGILGVVTGVLSALVGVTFG